MKSVNKDWIMSENIVEIAQSIWKHRLNERGIRANNEAIARFKTDYNGLDLTLWIVRKQPTQVEIRRDLHGNPIEVREAPNTTYLGDGMPIERDSKLGAILIQSQGGVHKYDTPGGVIDVTVINKSTYRPTLTERLALNVIVKVKEDEEIHPYPDILAALNDGRVLKATKEKESEISALRKKDLIDKEEVEKLLEELEALGQEKLNLDAAKSFIRENAKLRMQPILDPIQDRIRRSKLFDSDLIINGGPGTGKTTTLIQRIKFLTSQSLIEFADLTKEQLDILTKQSYNWIFYSPNELLRAYLREAMVEEGLTATRETVKVWNSHKTELMIAYTLFNSETKRPFLRYRGKFKDEPLIKNTSDVLKNLILSFKTFYIEDHINKFYQILDLDLDGLIWEQLGKSIQRYLYDKTDIRTLNDLFRTYRYLNENYQEEFQKISEGYGEIKSKVAAHIYLEIKEDENRRILIENLLKEWRQPAEEEVGEEEIFDEDENSDDDISREFDYKYVLNSKLESLCRKIALGKYDKKTRLNKRDRDLLELIPEAENRNEYEELGQIAYFMKFFTPLVGKIENITLNRIPTVYKNFRKNILTKKDEFWDLEILNELVKTDGNNRIHPDEQAFLLYFINDTGRKIARVFKTIYENSSHKYLSAYKKNNKAIIAIDEATDFSLIDLLAMHSMGNPIISSVTLSGDIMQKMTKTGINSWDSVMELIPGYAKEDLITSYRQSPTLLELANTIYRHSTGVEAVYKPFLSKSDNEPKPLIFESKDSEEKLEWIAGRILEIYNTYGKMIPSIAVFLSNPDEIDKFARDLGEIDSLADVGIGVRACRDSEALGDDNMIRVFPLENIKGLEFEAVFFHDFDLLLEESLSKDLLEKYLYVGLSRATFFLGLTVNNDLPESLDYLKAHFEGGEQGWRR